MATRLARILTKRYAPYPLYMRVYGQSACPMRMIWLPCARNFGGLSYRQQAVYLLLRTTTAVSTLIHVAE